MASIKKWVKFAGISFTSATICLTLLGSLSPRAAGDQIDLDNYELTFSEEFDELRISAWGPIRENGPRWIAHTPWAGDFGDAQFADPRPKFPFTVADGVLRIEARKGTDGKWRSGLLSSADPKGNGFHQKFGYFEMRAKLPEGKGLWSAFWLIANQHPDTSAEVDVLEHYGHSPDTYQSVAHVWPKHEGAKKYGEMHQNTVPAGSLYSDFRTYGVSIDERWTIFYHERKEMWRTPTPPEYHRPMFILFNLALGGGWPIDEAPSPSYMYVDYVKAFAKK